MDISNISKKFINGLMNYNLSYNDIIEEGFKYCGGDTGRHSNYFKEHFIKDVGPIEHTDYCVCGHGINENCYIINKDLKILILGNCCIKKFIPKNRRTCEICENIHINRKINICNICIKEYGRPCQLCKKYHKNKGINMCSLCRKNDKKICKICLNSSNNLRDMCKVCKKSSYLFKYGMYRNYPYNFVIKNNRQYIDWLINSNYLQEDVKYLRYILKV